MPQHSQLIRHAIPQIGLREIPIFSPATMVYERLRQTKEIRRLNSLRHLGALSHAFPGARHARWDYTAAMLYYADRLRIRGINSQFRIGGVRFSSAVAALQAVALVWNIGHIPGTFAVEKGVWRLINAANRGDPATWLEWPFDSTPQVRRLRSVASEFLREQDYLGLARVLAVTKLLGMCSSLEDELAVFTLDFAGPFLLGESGSGSHQWGKLRTAFGLARHLAYMTIDAPIAGVAWLPSTPQFLNSLLASGVQELDRLHSIVSEVLSPLEKMMYDAVYHSDDARRECALMAEVAHARLASHASPRMELRQWLRFGLLRYLKLGRRPDSGKYAGVGTVRLRSHFAWIRSRPVEVEGKLRGRGFGHPVAFTYPAWNSNTVLEPDEQLVQAFAESPVQSFQVGKLICG